MTTPKLYMLIGVPGSGKSTWVANQEWAKDCVYVSTDKIVEEEAERQGKTYNDIFHDYMKTAVDIMTEQVIDAREAGKDIIWDQTNVSVKSRAKKFRMLPDYYAIAVTFNTPEKEEHARRLDRPGKHIPAGVLNSMIENLEMPSEEEGFKEIWYT